MRRHGGVRSALPGVALCGDGMYEADWAGVHTGFRGLGLDMKEGAGDEEGI
jgi:hypothetical protein